MSILPVLKGDKISYLFLGLVLKSLLNGIMIYILGQKRGKIYETDEKFDFMFMFGIE